MFDYLDRANKLLGIEQISSLEDKCVFIAGLGGVGGTALEALVRSGVGRFVIVDFDKVDLSNLNRQILYVRKDVGKPKTEIAKERILSINPQAKVLAFNAKISDDFFASFKERVDFIVDAIDDVDGKLAIIKYSLANNIPFVSSLGMGNRIDPIKVKITKLNQTSGDPLARKIRYEARQQNLDLSKINVVFSSEEPLLKSKEPASMVMVPSSAGLLIAKHVLVSLINGGKNNDADNW